MIPKIVHFLWMSKDKDEKTIKCLESWKKHLDGYELREWNSESFPYQNYTWTKEATEAKKWAFVTDFFRLWVLFNYGGIYMDADMMLKKNFDSFLNCKFFAGTEYSQQIGPHCMGSEQGNSFVKKCLDFYENRHFKDVLDNNLLQEYTIPRIMTYILAETYNVSCLVNYTNHPIVIGNEMNIYGDNFFTIDIGDGQNVGVHECLGAWRDYTTLENPVYMRTVKNYYLRRFLLEGSIRFKFMFLPMICLKWYYKYCLKIKHIKTIMNVGKFI